MFTKMFTHNVRFDAIFSKDFKSWTYCCYIRHDGCKIALKLLFLVKSSLIYLFFLKLNHCLECKIGLDNMSWFSDLLGQAKDVNSEKQMMLKIEFCGKYFWSDTVNRISGWLLKPYNRIMQRQIQISSRNFNLNTIRVGPYICVSVS